MRTSQASALPSGTDGQKPEIQYQLEKIGVVFVELYFYFAPFTRHPPHPEPRTQIPSKLLLIII
jgi:hypothetical protein